MTIKKSMFLLVFFVSTLIFAQTATSGLIILEVHFSEKAQELNWIKVFNPESTTEFLGNLRISNIKTPNVLLPSLTSLKSIELKQGEAVILCANIEEFKKYWSDNAVLIEVNALSKIGYGGFIAVSKSEADLTKYDLLRYGLPAASESFNDLANYDVVPFSTDNKVFSRMLTKDGFFNKFGDWQ